MAINNVTVSHGDLGTTTDFNSLSADATNLTDDIHQQYQGDILYDGSHYMMETISSQRKLYRNVTFYSNSNTSYYGYIVQDSARTKFRIIQ